MKLWNAVGRLPVSLREGHGGNGGQALVELALVTTVMFLLLVGALDLGRVFYGQIVVTDAAKEGALVASQGGTYTDSVGSAVTAAKGGFVQVSAPNVTVAPTTIPNKPCGDAASSTTPPVTVTVKAPFTAITPIVSAILSGNGGFLTATATTPCRYLPALPGNPPGPGADNDVHRHADHGRRPARRDGRRNGRRGDLVGVDLRRRGNGHRKDPTCPHLLCGRALHDHPDGQQREWVGRQDAGHHGHHARRGDSGGELYGDTDVRG